MRGWLRPSIARRIIVALLLASTLNWWAIYVLGRADVFAEDTGYFDMELRITAVAIADVAGRHEDPAVLALALSGLDADLRARERVKGTARGFMAFRVADAQGRTVVAGGQGPAQAPDAAAGEGFFTHISDGQPYRVHRLRTAGGRWQAEVTQSLRSRQQVFDAAMFSRDGFERLLLCFPLLFLPVWLAVHTGLAPLRRLCATLASRPPADLSPLRVPPVYRELAPLVTELDGAFARLREMLERERHFLADAAHELRTPLALVGAQLDTLQAARTADESEQALQRLQGGLARAGRLVNQLLALARLDANQEDAPVRVDVADLARDCLAEHAALAGERGIELSYVGPDQLPTQCAPHALRSIMDNLVGNAVRYGRRGGQVELCLDTVPPGLVRLRIRDDGPGIPVSEHEQVFERFRRGSTASGSGSGLGLAIVRAAARRLDARLQLGEGLGGAGIGFELTWPATPPAPQAG